MKVRTSLYLSFRASLILALSLGALLPGCAISTRQTDAVLSNPGSVGPPAYRIADVPYIKQTENYCGPATLTMAMRYHGHNVGVEEIASQVYTPGKKGTLQQDMIGSARRQGMLAVQIQGLPNLFKELRANHPVIAFFNLGLSWYPMYHYALVTGYDVAGPSIFMHSAGTENKEWSMRKFERNWSQSWGLVVLPPTELSVAADELEHSGAAAGLEAVGRVKEAELVYRNILKRWPESFGALVGMGNLTYAAKDFAGSVAYLKRATHFHPLSAEAWHNRATAEGAAGLTKRAIASAKRAMELCPPEATETYRASLREWLLAPAAKSLKPRREARAEPGRHSL
ncbi:MAG: peptidase C39 family protein [Proteobacteria bacterium]|nr:MAG: peptidase C39 family protein [Pseudomonadota bacterium]